MDIVLQTNSDSQRLEFRNPEKFNDFSGYRVNLFVYSRGFALEWPFYFESHPLDEFIIGLEKMNQTLKGSSQLKPEYMPDFIEFKLDETGHLFVRGEVKEYSPMEQSLKFEFMTDQTCLKDFINGLNKLKSM